MAKKDKTSSIKDTEENPDLKKLMTRLDVAKKQEDEDRKTWKNIQKVLDFKREVVVGGSDTQTQKIKYPLLFGAYENYLSTLTSSALQIVIEADGKEDEVKKVFWKGVLAYVKRKLRVDDLREEIVQSFVVTGKVVLKVGRVVETKKASKPVEGVDGEKLMDDETEAVVKNHSFVEVVDPRKFFMSPETRYSGPVLGDECPYVIEEMIKMPEYIESVYGCKLDPEELEIIDSEDEESKNSPKENTDDLKRVRMYSYQGVWMLDGEYNPNVEALFTCKRILKTRKLPYDHGKKTYLVAFNFRKFFKPKAHGSLLPVMDLDQEYNENENRIRTYIRRMVNPKWAKKTGTQIDEDALLDPDVGVIVEESEAGAVRPLVPPSIDASIFDKSVRVETLFQLLTGIVYGSTAIQKAGTATGQGIVKEGADGKSLRQTGLLERLYEERDIMLLQLEQQFADPEGRDIRITGAEVVDMIKNKKILHQEKLKLYEEQQQLIQSGQATVDGSAVIGADGLSMGQLIDAPPIDEYDKFTLSEDGKAVITNYTPEDIAGEFELEVISQSSNRSNREVMAQQTINAINTANEPSIRMGLWRRLFTLYGWDELIDAIGKDEEATAQATQQQPLANSATPNPAAMAGAVNAQANQVV